MQQDAMAGGPILRLFEARAKPGCLDKLADKFATTSAEVVLGETGNKGYLFGRDVEDDKNMIVFASLWEDLDAVKTKFGSNWRRSYLPEGYEDLIADCSVRHINMAAGWHIENL